MRLADETITLRLEDEVLNLRPTLRAAMRLDRQYGGFGPVMKGLTEGSLTVMTQLVREGTLNSAPLLNHEKLLRNALTRQGFEVVKVPLLAFVCRLIGADWEKPAEESYGGATMTPADYYTRLFEIGTGWLGWAPDETWNATPAEILTAHKGRLDMLKAIYGAGKRPEGTPYDPLDTSVDEAGVEWLRTNSNRKAAG